MEREAARAQRSFAEMKRLVLDPDVLLSALILPVAPCAEIDALWLSRKIATLTAAAQVVLCRVKGGGNCLGARRRVRESER